MQSNYNSKLNKKRHNTKIFEPIYRATFDKLPLGNSFLIRKFLNIFWNKHTKTKEHQFSKHFLLLESCNSKSFYILIGTM